MIGLIIGLCLAVVALVVLVAILAARILWQQDERDHDHAACTAHVADITSRRILAMYARELARRWGSVEEKANLTRLARDEYKIGGMSMPEIWLLQQADLIDPENDEETEED